MNQETSNQPVKIVNYTIPGVPYCGVYNMLSKIEFNPTNKPVLEILEYWGDRRFNPDTISAENTNNHLPKENTCL